MMRRARINPPALITLNIFSFRLRPMPFLLDPYTDQKDVTWFGLYSGIQLSETYKGAHLSNVSYTRAYRLQF